VAAQAQILMFASVKNRSNFQNFTTFRPIDTKLLDAVTKTVIHVVILKAVLVTLLDMFRFLPSYGHDIKKKEQQKIFSFNKKETGYAAYFTSSPAPVLSLLFICLQDGVSCICYRRTHNPTIHIFNCLSEGSIM
jgi:hypothetical protein